MTRTKMIGWTAFAFCLLGYGTFTAVVVLNRMGEIALRETLLIGGPAAVIGRVSRMAISPMRFRTTTAVKAP